MAEVKMEKIPAAEVWAEFKLLTDLIDPPIVRLKLKPAFRSAILRELFYLYALKPKKKRDEAKDAEALEGFTSGAIALILRNIVDWDLTKDEEPIACDEENRRYFLEPLLWEMCEVEVEEKEDAQEPEAESQKPKVELSFFWVRLAGFLTNVKNFSKN